MPVKVECVTSGQVQVQRGCSRSAIVADAAAAEEALSVHSCISNCGATKRVLLDLVIYESNAQRFVSGFLAKSSVSERERERDREGDGQT